MPDCIFCKIANGEIPAKLAYQDDKVVAFYDINPQSPTHLVIIPRKHISTLNDLESSDAELMGQLILTGKQLASEHELAQNGWRIVFNCNTDAGQTVFHIHMHLLGGRKMGWPPG